MSGIQSFKQVLVSETPNHWCRPPPELELAANLTEEAKKHYSIPMETTHSARLAYSMCQMYDVNYTELIPLIIKKKIKKSHLSSWPKTSCKYGWNYDHRYFVENVVIKVNTFKLCKSELLLLYFLWLIDNNYFVYKLVGFSL